MHADLMNKKAKLDEQMMEITQSLFRIEVLLFSFFSF